MARGRNVAVRAPGHLATRTEKAPGRLDGTRARSLIPSRGSAPNPLRQPHMLTSIAILFILAMFGSTIAMVLRRGSGGSDKELQEMRERLLRLEQSMESMTGDMERVSESQRFMTALLE